MLVSVAVGIALQVLVTEVPYFIELFGTVQLSLGRVGRTFIYGAYASGCA